MKVIDPKHGNVAGHATVSVSIDGGKAFDITTNSRGKASFYATTAMKSLTLQLTDADDSIENPTFELHDALDFLREVDLDVLERMYTTEIATASCQDFRHYPEVGLIPKSRDHLIVRPFGLLSGTCQAALYFDGLIFTCLANHNT